MNESEATRNVTLSLPAETLRRAKIIAVERRTSLSRLLTETLKEVVERDSGYSVARDRSLARLDEGANLGTEGRVSWRREDLHDR